MTASQLAHGLQEVSPLHFGSNHWRQVININLLGVDASTLVIILNELVSDPHDLLEGLIMTHNTRFVSL
jgi:hypothetical protein